MIDITSVTSDTSVTSISDVDRNNSNKKTKYENLDFVITAAGRNKESIMSEKIKSFQYDHQYGLRSLASNIAALSGFHDLGESRFDGTILVTKGYGII